MLLINSGQRPVLSRRINSKWFRKNKVNWKDGGVWAFSVDNRSWVLVFITSRVLQLFDGEECRWNGKDLGWRLWLVRSLCADWVSLVQLLPWTAVWLHWTMHSKFVFLPTRSFFWHSKVYLFDVDSLTNLTTVLQPGMQPFNFDSPNAYHVLIIMASLVLQQQEGSFGIRN